jgi:hypothetical protein
LHAGDGGIKGAARLVLLPKRCNRSDARMNASNQAAIEPRSKDLALGGASIVDSEGGILS